MLLVKALFGYNLEASETNKKKQDKTMSTFAYGAFLIIHITACWYAYALDIWD